jgi:hypothetical protein
LIRDISAPFASKCSSCGNTNLSRVISGFAYHKPLKTVWEESGEPTMHPGDDYYKDPRNIGRWVEKSSRTWDRSYRPRFRRRYKQPGKACYLSR